jgi:hypothetical protein
MQVVVVVVVVVMVMVEVVEVVVVILHWRERADTACARPAAGCPCAPAT